MRHKILYLYSLFRYLYCFISVIFCCVQSKYFKQIRQVYLLTSMLAVTECATVSTDLDSSGNIKLQI